jgi:exoribonuclease-2
MELGNVVEYIDQQKILCAVVLDIKNKRLRLLNEANREINLSAGRISHASDTRLDLSSGRTEVVDNLKKIARRRSNLIKYIDIEELWDVLNEEQEWIDLGTMTSFCFPDNPASDEESAVVRAFFDNRLYFKFNQGRFFPHTLDQVKLKIARQKEAQRQQQIIAIGGRWLRALAADDDRTPPDIAPAIRDEVLAIVKAEYLHGKASPSHSVAKPLMAKAGVSKAEDLFPILVKAGIFETDENIDLLRLDVPVEFPPPVMDRCRDLVEHPGKLVAEPERKDLTMLSIMTIDGQATQDFDDAISLENRGDHFRLGVHIADVGYYVKKDDPVDRAALERGSSIYMPDCKISMLPSLLAEDLCSLKAGEYRPAISILIKLSTAYEIKDFEILPSWIRVMHQLSYYDVNLMAEDNRDIVTLRNIADQFRRDRLDGGAVQISLPDVNVWLNGREDIAVNRINRESPGRMLVSEIMIMANWVMAGFLADRNLPAIYRTQADPRERLFKGEGGTLFQNWMQRRHLSRFVLAHKPGKHSGLGLDRYTTVTSPIRKYFDLATQRQLRAALGLEAPYTAVEIDALIQQLEIPMSQVMLIQRNRNRYWLLKYLEGRIGSKEEAIVLGKRRRSYQILLKEYLLECDLAISSGIELKPEDLISVTIQHVNARRDMLAVFMG